MPHDNERGRRNHRRRVSGTVDSTAGVTVDRVVGGCAKAGVTQVPAGVCWEHA
jgi:hypothetical protein